MKAAGSPFNAGCAASASERSSKPRPSTLTPLPYALRSFRELATHAVYTPTFDRALKVRAAHHGRSTEAEIRDILEEAVRPANRLRIGSAMAALSREAGLTNADFEALEQSRDRTPAVPMSFE